MIKFNGKLYIISNKIIYKMKAHNIDKNAEYNIYIYNQQYNIQGISAVIFSCLISTYIYTPIQCIMIYNRFKNYINNEQLKKVYIAINTLIEKKWVIQIHKNIKIKCLKSKASIAINTNNKYFLLNLVYKTIDEVSKNIYNCFMKDNYSYLNSNEYNYLIGRRYINYTSDIEFDKLTLNIDYINIYIIFSYECNMKCIYCFERTKNQFYKKDNLSIDKLITILEKLSTNKKTIVTLYGGEPLLDSNKIKIYKIIDWAKNKNNIYFRIITNGINVSKFLPKFMQIYNKIIELVITVDGPRNIHDKRRILKNGKKSFYIIIQSIKLLCKNKIHVCIRVNIDINNIDFQINLLQYLNRLKLDQNLIYVEYYRVKHKSNPNYTPISYKQCYELYKKLSMVSNIKIKFGEPVISTIIDMMNNDDSYPYIRGDYCEANKTYVIDIDGKVYCCGESMGIKEFIKNLNSYNMPKVYLLPKKCLNCNIYYICYGGCYLERFYSHVENYCYFKNIMEFIKYECIKYIISKNS